MTTFGYNSTNEKIKGDSFMSFGMFTSDAGTPDKFVNINSLTVTGIEEGEGFIPDLDIPALNLKANNAATETVTTANVEQVKAVLAELKSAQADMNYPQSREFQSNLIAQIEAKIAAYEQGMAAAKTAEELLKALPASVNAENYAGGEVGDHRRESDVRRAERGRTRSDNFLCETDGGGKRARRI